VGSRPLELRTALAGQVGVRPVWRAATPREGPLGDHQQPIVILILRRAVERGNLVVAEITARELGRIDLGDALELTALVASKNRTRSRRMAARWLERWMIETAPAIDEAVMVVGCLAALGSTRHDEALENLRATTRAARPSGRSP